LKPLLQERNLPARVEDIDESAQADFDSIGAISNRQPNKLVGTTIQVAVETAATGTKPACAG
jgi:hypothetical protein